MNQKEKLYFEELSKQCREAWAIFKNPMYRGALEIAQNLYKDAAVESRYGRVEKV